MREDAARPRVNKARGERTAGREAASLLERADRRMSKLRPGCVSALPQVCRVGRGDRRTSTDRLRTRRSARSVPCVQRKERSTPTARRVPGVRSDQLHSPDGCPAGAGRTSNFNRRTGPRKEDLTSTPSIRPVLLAEDQRQTPQWQRSLLGEARATGIMHPGFYGRKPWKSQTVPLLLPDLFGVEYALEAIRAKSVDLGHKNMHKTYRKVHTFSTTGRGIVARVTSAKARR